MASCIGQITSSALHGIDGVAVNIEVTILPGLPSFDIVGLGDSAVREARSRVHAALKNNGYYFPPGKITASYAPAWLHKAGSAFDLPLALAVLMASGQIPRPEVNLCAFGELSLTGKVRPVPGVICRMTVWAQAEGVKIILPAANVREAVSVSPDDSIGVDHLNQAVEIIRQGRWQTIKAVPDSAIAAAGDADASASSRQKIRERISILRGQKKAMRALQLAAAGRHNLLLLGSPGCGKSTLAKLMPRFMPPLDRQEALLTTRIHSAAGQLDPATGLMFNRPFRSPHHSIGRAALMGGGAIPVPGEVSLAHQGVLFLDEMTEFRAEALDALRQPLEEHQVSISRLHHHYIYPADFILAAAANPCRCGDYFEPTSACRCTEDQVRRHLGKISGPLLDRFDMVVEMLRVSPQVLPDSVCSRAKSLDIKAVQETILTCWQRQAERCQRHAWPFNCNGRIQGDLATAFEISASVLKEAALLAEQFGLSVRGFQKLLRLARTIADFNGQEKIDHAVLAEACQFRIRLLP